MAEKKVRSPMPPKTTQLKIRVQARGGKFLAVDIAGARIPVKTWIPASCSPAPSPFSSLRAGHSQASENRREKRIGRRRTGLYAALFYLLISPVAYADGGISSVAVFWQLVVSLGFLAIVSVPALLIAFVHRANPSMGRIKYILLLLPALVTGGACLFFAWSFFSFSFRLNEIVLILGLPGVALFGPASFLALRHFKRHL